MRKRFPYKTSDDVLARLAVSPVDYGYQSE
jgi:hypothetical protein